jgi:hypothetical protein
VLETAEFTDKLMVAGVLPLVGVTVKKFSPELGTKVAVNGTLDAVVLVTCTLSVPGTDVEPAGTINERLLLESAIADVAAVTLRVTEI